MGFLCHLATTFNFILLYLKGLHLILDGWRPLRDEGGWKIHERSWPFFLRSQVEKGALTEEEMESWLQSEVVSEPPKRVIPKGRLFLDIKALSQFFALEEPVKEPV